jgi:ATP-dependent protease HslVU (ClpYQ) peptidase subunit
MDDVADSAIKLSKEARKDFTLSYRETMQLFPVLDNDQELIILKEQEIIRVANSSNSQELISLMKKDILLGLGYLNGFFDLLKKSIK